MGEGKSGGGGGGGEEQCKYQITHPLTVRQSLSRMSWARDVTSSVVSVPSAPWTSTGVPAHKVLQKYSVVWTSHACTQSVTEIKCDVD